MVYKFKTNDEQEAKRLIKSRDMAIALFEIVYNGWRKFKDTDYEYDKAWNEIESILAERNINIDELID